MSPETIRRRVVGRVQSWPIHQRPARLADLLTESENLSLLFAGIRPTNEWFGDPECVLTQTERVQRLEEQVDFLAEVCFGG